VKRWVLVGLAVGIALAGVFVVTHRSGGRCELVERRYGLSPCPPSPLPLEAAPIVNADPRLDEAGARRIGAAYLRSRALYYRAISANSEKLFGAAVIHRPDETPLMFGADVQHVKDAKARDGRLVLVSRAKVRRVTIVPLPPELRGSLGTKRLPMDSAVVVDAEGPELQVIRVPSQPDRPVSTLAAGDSYRLLVGGVLLEPAGLGETFAELGQWECLDPDTKGACLS
jgi:hypothetical protein